MSKDKKLFIRLIVAVFIYIVALIVHFTVALPTVNGFELYDMLMFLAVYLVIGYDVLIEAVEHIIHGNIFDENFLMTIATIGAFTIGEYPDAAAVMLLYQIGELFEHYAVGKSRKNIASLMDIRPETAVVVRDGQEIQVEPSEVQIGETIVVKAGDKIALDGIVKKGNARLDTSAITGESLPKNATVGDNVVSGCLNIDGVLYIETTSNYDNSTVAKILDLVENATAVKSPAENFITKFSKYYTPIVFFLAIAIGVIPPLFLGIGEGAVWAKWLKRSMMFLFVSCPCALVISVPLSFFGGIAAASKKGILVKGSSYLETLSKVDVVAFDKTGTLTKGNFEVDGIYPKEIENEVIKTAVIAEQYSNHPIAQSICKTYNGEKINAETKEIAGRGIKATTENGDVILCGNDKLMNENNINYVECSHGTVVYVAKNNKFVGYITIADQIKVDSADAIKDLNHQKCETIMLTGDNEKTASEIANKLGVSKYYSQLLPQDKVEKVNELKKEHKVAFVGDGINDAPVLASSDVGIAMGAMGSDVAIESADIVLMMDNPTAIGTAKRISKKTMKIVKENIIFSLAVKFAVLVLSAIGILDKIAFGLIIAILADVGVCMIAILNAMRAMFVGK